MSLRFRRFLPLLILATLELSLCWYLVASRRIPLGHDGFQYFYLKYYFFNDFVVNGELAQWMPYLTHGSPGSWWYVVQSGVFDAVGLFVARSFPLKNFLPIFYLLLFCEKLLFLAGMWLLASEHYRSRTAVFVATASMTLTSIWYTQPWWNFHAVMALPMLLFLVHRTITDFRWIWASGLGILFFLQTFGHLSYYLPITLLFLTAYAGVLLARPDVRAALRSKFRLSIGGVVIIVIVGAAMRIVMSWLQQSSSDIFFAYSSREPDGSVSLSTFLTYAGYTDLRSWNQLFTGLTPHLDFTMFSGFLILGLVMLTFSERVLNPGQKTFAWLTVGTGLLASASPLSILVYYFWPFGWYFRHLVLLQPVTKIFCILLAGATLDRLLTAPESFRRTRAYSLTVMLLPWVALLLILAYGPDWRARFLDGLISGTGLPLHPAYPVSTGRLLVSATAVALSWLVLFKLMRAFNTSVTRQRLGWAAALLLLADVSIYHWTEMLARTQKLSVQESSAFEFTTLPYTDRRILTPEASNSSRLQNWDRPLSKLIGENYWSLDILSMVDSYQTSRRTVFWSRAMGSLLLARTPADGLSKYASTLALPEDDKLLARAGGLEKPKVRFFSQAIACRDLDSTAQLLQNPLHTGNIALLTVPVSPAETATHPCDPRTLAVHDTLPSPEPSAKVVSFRSNRVTFEVHNPASVSVIMTYSDAWSDRWNVRINGSPSTVLRSDLAYKAVIVPPGTSLVEFHYWDRLEQLVFGLQTAGTVAFMGFLIWLIRWRLAEPGARAARQVPFESSSSTI